jgi:hypothetical protein
MHDIATNVSDSILSAQLGPDDKFINSWECQSVNFNWTKNGTYAGMVSMMSVWESTGVQMFGSIS